MIFWGDGVGGGGGGGNWSFRFFQPQLHEVLYCLFFSSPPPPPHFSFSFFLFVNLLILVFSFFFCILVLFVGCLSFFLLLFFCFVLVFPLFFVVVVFFVFVCFFLFFFFLIFFLMRFRVVVFVSVGQLGFFFFVLFFFNQICRPMTPGDTHTYVVIADIKRYTSFSTVQILRTRIAPLIGKAFTITSISIHTTKTKSKTLKSSNITLSFSCPLPFQCGGGLRPGSFADAPQDCSTSQDFSPRTVEGTENICRCVQHILQHFPTTMAFLTTSTIIFSRLASAAPQADSRRLGHVEPDNVVIADIAGQTHDIVLHSQVYAQA